MKKSFWINLVITSILLALVLIYCSCRKEMECGTVSFMTIRFDLDKKTVIDTIQGWQSGSVVCGEQFMNYKIQEQRDTIMTGHCVNGETLWYEKNIVKTN